MNTVGLVHVSTTTNDLFLTYGSYVRRRTYFIYCETFQIELDSSEASRFLGLHDETTKLPKYGSSTLARPRDFFDELKGISYN
jgi:hypothetical protein